MRKKLVIILVTCGVIALCLNTLTNYAKETDPKKLEENYNQYQMSKFIEEISFSDNQATAMYRLSDTVKLHYKWKLTTQKEEDILTYSIPKAMYIANDLKFDLQSENGVKLGEVFLNSKNNKMTIQFIRIKKSKKNADKLKGDFYFTVKLAPNYWINKEKDTINFPMDQAMKPLTIQLVQEEQPDEQELINGWGLYNPLSGNTEWNIRLNYAMKKLTDPEIYLALSNKERIIADSFIFYEIKENQLIATDKEMNVEVKEGKVKIQLEDMSNTYMLAFSTTNTPFATSIEANLFEDSTILEKTGRIKAFYTEGESILTGAK